MNVLSLCSGVGGLELGLAMAAERLGLPPPATVGYCERDAAALNVLAARMADFSLARAPVWFDLASIDARALPIVEIVTAGFPCQPHSVAGKRAGTDDARWLWDDIWRLVRDVGAGYLFVENVPGLLTSGGFDRVLGDLAASGWAAEWDCVPAAAVGAPHLRDRVFLLAADPERRGLREQPEPERGGGGAAEPYVDGAAGAVADAHGNRRQGQRRGGLLVGPGRGAALRRDLNRHAGARPASADSGHESAGPEPRLEPNERADVVARGGAGAADAHGTGLALGRVEPARDERTAAERSRDGWAGRPAPEPTIRGVDDGLARQLDGDRLFVLGNGVVPQAAAEAFVILWQRLHGASAPAAASRETGR